MTDGNAVALKPCPFCGGQAAFEQLGDHNKSTVYRCTECGCSLETGEEWGHGRNWNTRAPTPAPVERREAIARIIAGPLCDATKGEHSIATQGNYLFCTQCGETISRRQHGIVDARNKADAILALPCPDEAAIRADEREKCASEAFTAITSTLITNDGGCTYADHIAHAIRNKGDAL